ncbi:MAG: hypothetical protein KKF74_01310 [Nanoarchaeota archaeon]|nr:hypothetical protein [Nanoarchaeota archaeon]
MKTAKLEDITSKEFLNKALENAKSWCQLNLPTCLQGFQNGFDYPTFRYIIDNDLVGTAMALDNKKPGLIRVSAEQLKWYKQKEDHFKAYGLKEPETDPRSMFVHEITEFIVSKTPEVFLHYFPKREFPHSIARQIENINRRERGLREWLEY